MDHSVKANPRFQAANDAARASTKACARETREKVSYTLNPYNNYRNIFSSAINE